nr:MAG TPA: hypothetical protein [Caudoviricetes sp.]
MLYYRSTLRMVQRCLLRIVSTLKAKKADTYSCLKRDKKKNLSVSARCYT